MGVLVADLTYENMKQLVEIATGKGTFDYLSIVLSSVVTLIAVGMSYFFFQNHAKQVTNEKVIEKEVEKLYEAVDCLFEFSNAADLYLSMKEKSLNRRISGIPIDGDFKDKVENATEEVFKNFRHVHKSSFILRALGESEASAKVDMYRSCMISFRKDIYKIEMNADKNGVTQELHDFMSSYGTRKSKLDKERDKCLDAVAECKKGIKSVS